MTLKKVVPGHWKLLTAIYFCSLIVRIAFFSTHVPFSQDNVRDVTFIRSHISEGNFLIPFGPSTSVGNFSLPPFYYYLQLFAQLAFFNQFYAMDFLVILIESLTPVLLYHLVFKITRNRFSSIGASAVYILSPAVLLASNAWNPNLVPFFSLLFISSFIFFITEKKALWFTSGLVSLVVLTSLHFQWFVLLPFVVILLISGLINIQKTWKAWIAAIVISLVIFFPYLYHESANQFSNSREAINFLSQENTVFDRVRKPAYVAFFFPNYYHRVLFNNLLITSWEGQYDTLQLPLIINSAVFFALFFACIRIAWNLFRSDKKAIFLIYIAMFISMMIFLRFYKGDKLDYYLHVFLSFIFVFIGVFFHTITKHKTFIVKLIPFGVLAIIELTAVLKISPYNDYSSYKNITDNIVKLSKKNTVIVEPQNKELEKPLRYFLSEDVFTTNVEEVQYRILFCYKNEQCEVLLKTNESFILSEGAFTGAFFKVK